VNTRLSCCHLLGRKYLWLLFCASIASNEYYCLVISLIILVLLLFVNSNLLLMIVQQRSRQYNCNQHKNRFIFLLAARHHPIVGRVCCKLRLRNPIVLLSPKIFILFFLVKKKEENVFYNFTLVDLF
jgi:hypothetical protein